MKRVLQMAAFAALGFSLAASLVAQTGTPPPTDKQDQASSKQDRAKRAFADVTERMQKLQVKLADTDPDKARLLGIGNKFVQERRINKRMADIQALLENREWDEAVAECAGVLKDLDKLIVLLLKGDSEVEELIKEIERLEQFKARVEKLIKEQQKEKEDSAKAEALQKHLKDLAEAKKATEQLIEEQRKLQKQTNDGAFAAKPEQNQQAAKQEGDLKDAAGKLSKELEKLEANAKALAEPKDGKPSDGKPSDGGGSAGSGSPGQGGSSGSAQSAQQNMGGAQNKLQDNQPQSSLEDMEKAVKDLEKVQADLDKMEDEARRQLKSLPFEELSKKQQSTQVETDRLAKDMEKSEKGDGDAESKGPTPGKQNVQQAVPKQKAAAGQLKEQKPAKAKQEQQDAKDDLEEAKRALDEALAQLRQQLQDEILRSLEERFGEMLNRQKKITANTQVVDRLRKEALTADGEMPASLKERTEKLGAEEFGLAGDAQDALKLLEEEGTTAVFPEMVDELAQDLRRVGKRLQEHRTARATHAAQLEIEETLKALIDALRRAIEENDKKGEP